MTTNLTNSTNKVPNVPPLRFPEFTGEWERKRIGNDCKILMCKRILSNQTTEVGDVPFYKIGTIGGEADAYISNKLFEEYKQKYSYPDAGEVMISCAGTIGKTIIYDGKPAYYQDSNIVWISNPKQLYLNSFLRYVLFKVDWRKLNTTTIMRIYNDNLRELPIVFPSVQEQQKIVSFLSLIDKRIGTQNKIIQHLESLIKGINDNVLWQYKNKVALREILKERSERTATNNQYPIISSTAKGLFLQSEYFDKEIASADNIGYKVLRKENIVLSPQNLWLGNINYNDKYEIGMVSPSYKIFTISENFNSFYVACLLKTYRALYEYACVSEQGASVVRRNLDMEAFMEILFPIPTIEEQSRIAEGLQHLYHKLEIEKQILEKLKEQKKYLLSQMFI